MLNQDLVDGGDLQSQHGAQHPGRGQPLGIELAEQVETQGHAGQQVAAQPIPIQRPAVLEDLLGAHARSPRSVR
jgi:hypothetical protein